MTGQDHHVDVALATSRPLGVARELLGAGAGADAHRFQDLPVLLTGEVATLRTPNGRTCLLYALRLLASMVRDLTIAVPAGTGDFIDAVRAEAARVGFAASIQVVSSGDGAADYERYEAILSVGRMARPDLPWTVVNAHGWLARVSSGATDLPGDGEQVNPVAALAAASLGVSEVFKRLVGVSDDRGVPLDGVGFNLFSYKTDDHDPGPVIDRPIELDVLLVGAGAIGSGITGVLSELDLTGHVEIIDRQAYADENLGTCLLVGPDDLGRSKAEVAAETLRRAGISATGHEETITAYRQRGDRVRPSVILNGLDNVEARHEIQGMWPDLVVDGAIGRVTAQVSRHPWGEDVACLRCLFQLPRVDVTAATARLTGLREERVRQGRTMVTEQDVAAAPEEHRERVRRHVGQEVCSILSAKEREQLESGGGELGFDPSVPFVACLSASMVVGELVKHALGLASAQPLDPLYQVDLLHGPEAGEKISMGRRTDCICVTRRASIERARNLARSATRI